MDSLGDTLWTRTFGEQYDDRGTDVKETTDNGYVIAGYSKGDLYLIKTDNYGDILWTRKYGEANLDVGWSIHQTADHGYIVTGYTESFGAGGDDVWLLKIEPDTLGIVEHQIVYSTLVDLEILPNPIHKECNMKYNLPQKTNVNISLYNVTGRLIKEVINEDQNIGIYYKVFDMGNFAQGVYFIRLNTDGLSSVKKVIFLK